MLRLSSSKHGRLDTTLNDNRNNVRKNSNSSNSSSDSNNSKGSKKRVLDLPARCREATSVTSESNSSMWSRWSERGPARDGWMETLGF